MANPCAKTVKKENAYEVWKGYGPMEGWTWYVLKKWQIDDAKLYARWFCQVFSPIVPDGEFGDVYVADVKSCARKVENGN